MLQKLRAFARQFPLVRRAYRRLHRQYSHLKFTRDVFLKEKVRLPLFRRIVARSVKHVYGPRSVRTKEDELVVVCLVCNGAPYVRPFIEHYRSLGAKHIAFMDNGSNDDTVALASEYDDVTVLSCELPFQRYDVAMRQYLVDRFSGAGWVLYVDSDELFDYPFSDQVPLRRMLRYLNRNGYTAVVAQMLDLFPDKPLLDFQHGEALRETHRFYDISDVEKGPYYWDWASSNVVDSPDIGTYYGGVRQKAFGMSFKSYLTKHPLVKLGGGFDAGNFFIHYVRNARVADFMGVLLHYQFAGDFGKKVRTAAQGDTHYKAALKRYRQYAKMLREKPDLRLGEAATTREFNDVNELVENGFLVCSEAFAALAPEGKAASGDTAEQAELENRP